MEIEVGLYLIPCQLSDGPLDGVLPARNVEVVRGLRHFVVEKLRSARRFIKKCDRNIDIDSLTLNDSTNTLTLRTQPPLRRCWTPSAVASRLASSATRAALLLPTRAPTW